MSDYPESYRVVTFVPAEAAERFADTVTDALPALFGNYDKVAWWSEPKTEHGTEQYRPLDGATPVEGKTGEVSRVPSVRMEFSVPADKELLRRFIGDTVIPAHPWEQPVILVYEVQIAQPD